jgi:UDP-hydrolysing UDP-N-acetyl-D-glucosamine 2-epimerase
MLAMAIASSFMNIPVAHTMGGEISGTIDESVRHAITKLAHIHFPATERAKKHIIKMGEDPSLVFNVGCPRMDTVKEVLKLNRNREIKALLRGKDGVGDSLSLSQDFILVSQHPVTTEFGNGEAQINETLIALRAIQDETKIAIVMLWPNVDAGSDDIARGIRKFRESHQITNIRLFKNLPPDIYMHLMKKARCLVGNSSSGIREGAFIGTPVVNIGTRQAGREYGKNVISVGYNNKEIRRAIKQQMQHGLYASDTLYGNGMASKKIIKILKTVNPNIQKRLFFQ